jgi:pentatricopeptide repeat protein
MYEKENVFSWNAMIGGYMQMRFIAEALKLFHEIPEEMWSHGMPSF